MRIPIRVAVATATVGVVLAGVAWAGTALAGTTPTTQPPATATVTDNIRPSDAQHAILAAFDKYDVVGGMSPAHGVKDVDDFIIDLIRNPNLPGKVNDIAVECGNSLYQPVLDRYIAGEDVPLAEVRQVWRNTTQPSCGFSTFYEELFPLIRRINEKLPQSKKLRVLACDPPIDWTKVESQDDLVPFMERDTNIASVMEAEVLSKHRKALMLFGLAHMTHGGGAVRIYEQRYPNATFVIADHRGFAKDNDKLEQRMASWPVPSLVTVKGTWLDKLDSSYFPGFPGQWGSASVDAYLYVGRRAVLMHQPISARTVLDNDYIAELEHRADALGDPPDSPLRPATTFRDESESSALFYNAR
jgi:hypothetical protein